VYNPNNFFFNLKQRTAVKAVDGALRYIKKYVAGVSVKIQKCRGTSHSTSEHGLEQFTVLLKLKSTF